MYNEAALAIDQCRRLDLPVAKRASFSGTFTEAGHRPEEYNAQHVSSLGTADKEWELFVDGYCPDTGKRVRPETVTCFCTRVPP